MSGAPYGYRYIRKTEEALAAYIIHEAEARVVRRVYEMYTVEGLSIAEITRRLNREGIPPRRASRWERSVVWGMLRNPAYRGVACFGKTRLCARTQMRPQRRRGITSPSNTAGHQRPREEWIPTDRNTSQDPRSHAVSFPGRGVSRPQVNWKAPALTHVYSGEKSRFSQKS